MNTAPIVKDSVKPATAPPDECLLCGRRADGSIIGFQWTFHEPVICRQYVVRLCWPCWERAKSGHPSGRHRIEQEIIANTKMGDIGLVDYRRLWAESGGLYTS